MNNTSDKKYCFAGNRFFVLGEMLDAGLDVVRIFAVKGSFLERELTSKGLEYEVIENKKWLVEQLMNASFDYFVANGLPIILPIGKLCAGNHKKFINIHPSYLPDLRGIDPVPGSLLHGRSSGATCHYMNDAIDGGNIIAQVEIPYTDDMDCGLLYQLSFMAEREVFRLALDKKFSNAKPQILNGNEIYYNLKEQDKQLDFSKNAEYIVRQVNAFNTRSQGAYFLFEGERVIIRDATIVTNPYLIEKCKHLKENEVVMVYENKILLKKEGCCVKLKPENLLPIALKQGWVWGSTK
jgi:methionyl-tRNA formyltransferase